MGKIIKITEDQYNAYINGEGKSIIDEAMHYPKFLDSLFFEASVYVGRWVKEMLKNRESVMEYTFIPKSNTCFKQINIKITLRYNVETVDKKNYKGFANSNEILTSDNQLEEAYLTFEIPISYNGEFDISYVRSIISHEGRHLYDDWNDLIHGGEGIFVSKKNITNNKFFKKFKDDGDLLLQTISWLCYMDIHTETNAFSTQLMSELRGMQCNYSNVQVKFKETASYSNLKKTETDFFNSLNETNDYGLYLINSFIMDHYRETSIPKLNMGQFNGEKYRGMLKKWGERIVYRLIKRYMGVVQLYKDELTESYFTDNCILIR